MQNRQICEVLGTLGREAGGKTDTVGTLPRGAHAPRSRSTTFAMYFIIKVLQGPSLRSWQLWRVLTL